MTGEAPHISTLMTRREPNRHRVRRWLPWAGLVLLAGLVVLGLWPKPVPVETAPATRGPLRVTVNEEGKTRIRHRYVVSAPVAGLLRRIPFKAGAEVVSNQTVVAVIDPVPPNLLDARTRSLAQASRDAAAANLEKARVALAYARSELRRAENLFAAKTLSAQELEAAQLREAAAVKDVAAAEASLQEAEARLADFGVHSPGATSRPPVQVLAPAGTRILRVFEESSRVVPMGTPLVEIGDPTDLEVVVEVLSRDGAVILPGARVEFEQWGGPLPLIGRVRLVEPAAFTKISALGVEEQRVNVVADLVTPPEERSTVGDNFRVEARIVVWEAEQVLKVPVGSLFRRGDGWSVFVLQNGRAHSRPVKVGRSSGIETQILEGLQENESVILYPGNRVRDGQRVRPISV